MSDEDGDEDAGQDPASPLSKQRRQAVVQQLESGMSGNTLSMRTTTISSTPTTASTTTRGRITTEGTIPRRTTRRRLTARDTMVRTTTNTPRRTRTVTNTIASTVSLPTGSGAARGGKAHTGEGR